MEEKKLYIKNMVCDRCVSAVKSLLDELQIGYSSVTLGEVVLSGSLSAEKKEKFRDRLLATGFVLIDDKRSRLIVQVKSLIIDLVHYHSEKLQMNLSDYLSGKLHLDYHYISDFFRK